MLLKDIARKAYFSGKGDELEFVSPGVNILTTDKDGGYQLTQGTSFAAPHIVGLLALLKEQNPSYTKKNCD